jgi:hypothetical protein
MMRKKRRSPDDASVTSGKQRGLRLAFRSRHRVDSGMADERDIPTEEVMRTWSIEPPDDWGWHDEIGEPLSDIDAAAHRKRIEAARKREATEMREEEPGEVKPAMSTEEIKAAGASADIPTEAAAAEPGDITYSDGSTLLERLRARKEESTSMRRRRTRRKE